jgi:hypothetical protein
MAHLWLENADGIAWAVLPLAGITYDLSEQRCSAVEELGSSRDYGAASVLLVRRNTGPQEQWLLLARKRANVQVNGSPLVLGVRLLCDRDEIALRADDPCATFRCFFSTERLAQAVAYPGGNGGAIRCPRCKQPIDEGQMAVQCPNPSCGAWHHQEAALPCWTYSVTCALCDRPTQLDAGFRWTPEDL